MFISRLFRFSEAPSSSSSPRATSSRPTTQRIRWGCMRWRESGGIQVVEPCIVASMDLATPRFSFSVTSSENMAVGPRLRLMRGRSLVCQIPPPLHHLPERSTPSPPRRPVLHVSAGRDVGPVKDIQDVEVGSFLGAVCYSRDDLLLPCSATRVERLPFAAKPSIGLFP